MSDSTNILPDNPVVNNILPDTGQAADPQSGFDPTQLGQTQPAEAGGDTPPEGELVIDEATGEPVEAEDVVWTLDVDGQERSFTAAEVDDLVARGLSVGKMAQSSGLLQKEITNLRVQAGAKEQQLTEVTQLLAEVLNKIAPDRQLDVYSAEFAALPEEARAALKQQGQFRAQAIAALQKIQTSAAQTDPEPIPQNEGLAMIQRMQTLGGFDQKYLPLTSTEAAQAQWNKVSTMMVQNYGFSAAEVNGFLRGITDLNVLRMMVDLEVLRAGQTAQAQPVRAGLAAQAGVTRSTTPQRQVNAAPAGAWPQGAATTPAELNRRKAAAKRMGLTGPDANDYINGLARRSV